MKIEINLKNSKYCTGCPCLQLKNSGHNYYNKCGLGYKIEREQVTRGETGNYQHPDLVAYYRTIRSKKCIKELKD